VSFVTVKSAGFSPPGYRPSKPVTSPTSTADAVPVVAVPEPVPWALQ
jgi:hypothetical protein